MIVISPYFILVSLASIFASIIPFFLSHMFANSLEHSSINLFHRRTNLFSLLPMHLSQHNLLLPFFISSLSYNLRTLVTFSDYTHLSFLLSYHMLSRMDLFCSIFARFTQQHIIRRLKFQSYCKSCSTVT